MDDSQKEKLNEMIEEFKTIDSTEELRRVKKSTEIIKEVNLLRKLVNANQTEHVCKNSCPLLSKTYTHIFEGIVNKTIDFNILTKLLDNLKSIENGTLDQHEASFKVGSMLKEVYINDKLNIKKEDKEHPENNLTWKQFKEQR